jgi:hypothetical protein
MLGYDRCAPRLTTFLYPNRYLRKMKDVMKMSAPGSNLGGSATPLGGAAAAVGDSWGRGWGVLGNKVSSGVV